MLSQGVRFIANFGVLTKALFWCFVEFWSFVDRVTKLQNEYGLLEYIF
jgi:hypothetical protein